jgi:dipeptidyl-peptidase-4
VASAPAFDPSAMVSYECYLDLPRANPEGYALTDPFPLAAKVDGALMLASGTSDTLCWPDAVRMSEASIRAGALHEYVVLPEAHHTCDEVHDAYFWRKVADFFGRHLG